MPSLRPMALALIAMGLGAYCAVMVALRYRHRDQPARVERYRTRVIASGIGILFGLAAAV